MNILKKFTSRLVQISSLRLCIFQIFITTFSVAQPITYSKRFQPTLMTYQAYSCLHFNLMFFWPYIMNLLYIDYQLDAPIIIYS